MAKKALTLSPGGSTTPKKARKGRKAKRTTASTSGKRKTSSRRRRSTSGGGSGMTGFGGSLAKTGLEAGKVVLPGAAASAAHGFFGDKIKFFGGKVDARLLAVAGALAYKQFGKPSASVSDMVTKGAIGVLGSWLNEQAFDVGAAQQAPAVVPAVPATEGMVIGNVYGAPQTGAFWQSAEKRLARKLAKAKKKAEKKGLDWKDIREDAEDLAEKKGWGGEYGRDDGAGPAVRPLGAPGYYGPPPVMVRPRPRAWFLGRRRRALARAI